MQESQQMTYQNKTRQRWSEEEHKKLIEFVQLNGTTRKGWKTTSKSMMALNFDRNPKACRERYKNNGVKHNSTDLDLEDLFYQMDVNGNKWSLIAKSVNMTDRQVKNFFYANVNRIFRRLIKLTFQTKKSTLYSRQIKPKLISSLLCVEGPHSISDDIKQNFKNLILENQDIQHYSKLNQETQQQVSNIFEYLEQENYLLKHTSSPNVGSYSYVSPLIQISEVYADVDDGEPLSRNLFYVKTQTSTGDDKYTSSQSLDQNGEYWEQFDSCQSHQSS